MKQIIDASNMQAQPEPCRTCPFAGREPITLSPARQAEITQSVCSFQGSHLCHSTNNQTVCRGGRDLQIRLAFLRGLIGEPTDDAFQAALNSAAEKPS